MYIFSRGDFHLKYSVVINANMLINTFFVVIKVILLNNKQLMMITPNTTCNKNIRLLR